ncbi:MAG TPA: gamma-glutamyl-gamma-aminobutyrate hydrolase family protein [Longilinea sp.]|nr:gamma-glutamyl-gamma-aminobutyrate hydrolase family protein [Longilinea sp.]
MSTPRIGLTTGLLPDENGTFSSNLDSYLDALHQAGADPIPLYTTLPDKQPEVLAKGLSAILFCGGGDISPIHYHQDQTPLCETVNPARDLLEIPLARYAIDKKIPFLGICRGLQVINVALGGNLYQDIHEEKPEAIEHNYYGIRSRHYRSHFVSIDPASKLAQIIGVTHIKVNSLHHQGINVLAQGLHATAHARDGLVEAVEFPDHPFGLAVQWHPEEMTDSAEWRALFSALVVAARLYVQKGRKP